MQKNEWPVGTKKGCLRTRLNPPDNENKKEAFHEVGRSLPNLERGGTSSKNAERANDLQKSVAQNQSEETESYKESNLVL